MTKVEKTLAMLSPAQLVPEGESEHTYSNQLIPLARSLFMSDPLRKSYITIAVMNELSDEGWSDSPSAWRFTIATQELAHATSDTPEGDTTAIPPDMRLQIAELTQICVRDLHRWQVEELRLVSDEGDGVGIDFLQVFRRNGSSDISTSTRQISEWISSCVRDTNGIRSAVLNLVESESETMPIREPGQIYTGALLSSTEYLALVEGVASTHADLEALDRCLRLALGQVEDDIALATYTVQRTVQFDRTK